MDPRTTTRHLAAGALTLLLVVACAGQAPADVAVGQAAPAFELVDLDGRAHSLADHRGKVVVLEWINPNCPVSDRHAREKTMSELTSRHDDVVWLAINSTNRNHGDYVAPAEHKRWAAERGIDYAILYDDDSAVGRAYGAQTTPHMFIVDEAGEIAYNGAIDNDPPGRKDKAQRTNYVDGGLVAHAAGRPVDPATTRPYGCSVKY
jgi:peroxiredoxin